MKSWKVLLKVQERLQILRTPGAALHKSEP